MLASGVVKLRAHDPQDMEVISAVLQDALVPLRDVAYLKGEKRFVLVANRFRWESQKEEAEASPPVEGDAAFEDDAPPAPYERVNCGICFDRVKQVRTRGLDLANKDQILNLLTVQADPWSVTLMFSDGAAIRLEVAGLHCHVEDLGEPWPTHARPDHPEDVEEPKASDASPETNDAEGA